MNRIDRLLVFRFLSRSEFGEIVRKFLRETQERLFQEYGIYLELHEDVYEWFLNHGVEREYGARSLKRKFKRKIREPIAGFVNTGEIGKDDRIVVGVNDPDKEDTKFLFEKHD